MNVDETKSEKMELHWQEEDGRMAMVWAQRYRPRRVSVERLCARRDAVTEPMAVPSRKTNLPILLVALLVVLIACVAGLLR